MVAIRPAGYPTTKGTKHALSKAEESTKEEKIFLKPDGFVNPVLLLRVLRITNPISRIRC